MFGFASAERLQGHNARTYNYLYRFQLQALAAETSFAALSSHAGPADGANNSCRPHKRAQGTFRSTSSTDFFIISGRGRKTKQKPVDRKREPLREWYKSVSRLTFGRVAQLNSLGEHAQAARARMLAATYYQSPPPPAYGMNKPVQYYMESMPTSSLFYACARWVFVTVKLATSWPKPSST